LAILHILALSKDHIRMKYYIGIDGGGTKTICVLADENLFIRSSATGPATNPLVVGFEKSALTLLKLIKKTGSSKKISFCEIGIAGTGLKNNSNKLKKILKIKSRETGFKLPPFEITTDIRITLEGAFAGAPGSILISGTGSIAFAKDKKDNLFRAGGFGRIIGDEGSGYSIGRRVLSSIAGSLDGRVNDKELLKSFQKKFGIWDSSQLISMVHSEKFQIAGLAEFAISEADRGNRSCRKILDEEAEQLIMHLKPITRKLMSKNFRLCLSGSLLNKKNYFSSLVKEKIMSYYPGIIIKNPEFPPEIGAVMMAKKINLKFLK